MNDSKSKAPIVKDNTSILSKFASVIAAFSIGKYSPKLYHKGQSDYSSCISGLLTIFIGIGLVFVIYNILLSTFNKDLYTLTESSGSLMDSRF